MFHTLPSATPVLPMPSRSLSGRNSSSVMRRPPFHTLPSSSCPPSPLSPLSWKRSRIERKSSFRLPLRGVLLRQVRQVVARVRLLAHPELRKRRWPLRGPRGDGNGDRSPALRAYTQYIRCCLLSLVQCRGPWSCWLQPRGGERGLSRGSLSPGHKAGTWTVV